MNIFANRRMFWSTTPVIFEKMAKMVPPEFIADRSKMMQGADFGSIPLQAPDARIGSAAISTFWIANSRPRRSCSAIHSASPMRRAFIRCGSCAAEPNLLCDRAEVPQPHAMVRARRCDGRGDMRPMDPDEALKIAKESTPAPPRGIRIPGDLNGLQLGAKVGGDAGRLRLRSGGWESGIEYSVYEIAIEREEPT